MSEPAHAPAPQLPPVAAQQHAAAYTGQSMENFAAQPGDLTVLRNWKYDGATHWAVPTRYVGSTRHGHWFYQREGDFLSRPGHGLYMDNSALMLVPVGIGAHPGALGGWIATFHNLADGAPSSRAKLYIDTVWDISFRPLERTGGWEVNSVDMDLDVVRTAGGTVYIDDEDEFAEHQVSMGYPAPVIAEISEVAARLREQVACAAPPFDVLDVGQLLRALPGGGVPPARGGHTA